jgi:hypothetical protein
MTFQKAVKHEAKLRLAIAGPSGSGKTFTSLSIATALANGGKIALVDTEHGSASKYADLFEFDVLELTAPFHPKRFVEAITEAGKAGYSVIILDSLTHAWSGPGGLLEIVDGIAARMKSANTFAAWKDATPIQNSLVEGIVAAPLHLIATMRSKQEYILTQDERGKQVPRKVGMAPQQRDGFEYEFDVFIDMDIDNTGIVQKTRCPALTGGVFKKPGADVAGILLKWLQGAPVPVTVERPAPEASATAAPQNGKTTPATVTDTPVAGRPHWNSVDDAVLWGYDQGAFKAVQHAQNAYNKLRTEALASDNPPTGTKDMFNRWHADVLLRQEKAKSNTITDAELDGTDMDPVTAGDFEDETPGF